MNPFDYVNSISYNKKDIMVDDVAEKEYQSFLINRALSYYPDTIFHANEINMRPGIHPRLAYDYYLNIIRPRKRFSKWHKKENDKNIEIVREYYKVSYATALEYVSILNEVQLNELRKRLYKGEST